VGEDGLLNIHHVFLLVLEFRGSPSHQNISPQLV
jgi:hypothetical protein